MKQFAILLLLALPLYACRKTTNIKKPTKDFREKYIGVFHITKREIVDTHPSFGGGGVKETMHSCKLTVSYSLDDSIKDYRDVPFVNMPALVFTYECDAPQRMGIDILGNLYFFISYGLNDNSGGFINQDSISYHYTSHSSHSSTEENIIWGARE